MCIRDSTGTVPNLFYWLSLNEYKILVRSITDEYPLSALINAKLFISFPETLFENGVGEIKWNLTERYRFNITVSVAYSSRIKTAVTADSLIGCIVSPTVADNKAHNYLTIG